jgi:hypothetical protein
MIRQNQVQHWLQLAASLGLVGLAAIGCGADKASDGADKGAAGTGACALNPNAPTCRPPMVENPSLATSMPIQGPVATAGTAAVGTTPPATPPAVPASRPPMPAPNFGTGAMAGAPPGLPPAGTPGVAGSAAPPTTPAVAGAPANAGTAGAPAAGGPNVAGIPDAELNTLRQACVDEINMYRATLTAANLKPMKRANPMQENCSDRGAQMDGDSGQAHGAARANLCGSVGLFAENTCPGWPVGGFAGATLTDVMK